MISSRFPSRGSTRIIGTSSLGATVTRNFRGLLQNSGGKIANKLDSPIGIAAGIVATFANQLGVSMKKLLAAFAAIALTAVLPAQATTFSSLTLIYTFVGVQDYNNAPAAGTTVMCVNQSGQNATVRWRFLGNNGAEKGTFTLTFGNGVVYSVATNNGTGSYFENTGLAAASNFAGRVVIYSTQSAVFCNAVTAQSSTLEVGNSLPAVRFHPNPGTIE